MLDLVDTGLAIFWLGLAIVFLTMAKASHKMKDELSATFKEAEETVAFKGAGIAKLQPILTHMLSVDVNGFRISAAAAIVELMLVILHLFT